MASSPSIQRSNAMNNARRRFTGLSSSALDRLIQLIAEIEVDRYLCEARAAGNERQARGHEGRDLREV